MPNTDAERLAALLAEDHAIFNATNGHVTCTCDPLPWMTLDEYATHVAAVLAEAGVGDVAEVERERDEYAERLSVVLCDLTGGRLSKPTYSAQTMIQEIDAEHERRTEAALADLRARVKPLARECQGLVSRYTRAPGENGDRVADLLSEDTHRIGTAILALLGEEIEALLPEEDTTDG